MEDNILNSVKKSIGIMPEYKAFDDSLIMHINSVFMILAQMGVGPSKGFRLEDGTENGATSFLAITRTTSLSNRTFV